MEQESAEGPKKILMLVDDEINILSALTRLFRREGYRIITADSGSKALELLETEHPGVIISDQRMPGMTGSEFLAEASARQPNSVRIILSGYTELNSVTDAINHGHIFKFLTKPWDDDLLKANIREAFRHHEMDEENNRLTTELKDLNARLMEVNGCLEELVSNKTKEALRNISVLKVVQEIIDVVPVGVIGMDTDLMMTTVNKVAMELFMNMAMTGMSLYESPYPDILDWVQRPDDYSKNFFHMNGVKCRAIKHVMGASSGGVGKVLVFIPENINDNWIN